MYRIMHRSQSSCVVRFGSWAVRYVNSAERKAQSAKRIKAFTLIEMLVVVVMFSLVALAVASTLNNGIKIWQRLNQKTGQEDINIFFERIAWELRNSFEFDTIGFQGSKDRVNFAALVSTPGSIKAQETGIGEITYFYDSAKKRLNRQIRSYSQIYKGNIGTEQDLLKDLIREIHP